MSNSENNKRIVKNTLALYFRQIIVMVVSLFTSRIVLQTLGVTDYGINNVVGGVVAMFGFISGTLMGITQRFISVELGKGGDLVVLRKIFSTSMILHVVAAVIVVILAETVGLWFLNNKLVIPVERMIAANWVYQFAMFGFALSLLNAPLMALVVSHEDMHIYGYMGIFDVVTRLVTVYLLVIVNTDKLIFMAIFGFGVGLLVWMFYRFYCRRRYKYARFQWVLDKGLVKELSGFGSWTFFNSIFSLLRLQGINIILNMFFGPAVNAARGIAVAVENALTSFGNNFRQAQVPQLIKLYSANDKEQMWSLTERGTRISYFLIFIFFVPILLQTEFILKLWLGNVPEYSTIFTKLLMVDVLTTTIIGNLVVVNNAMGKIKAFSICHYVNSMAILIISYSLCKTGYAPQHVFVVPLLLRLPVYAICFVIFKIHINLSIRFFCKKALIPMFLASVMSFLPFYFFNNLFMESFFHSFIIIITSMLWTGVMIMFIGLRKNEQTKVLTFIKQKISHK